MILLSTGSLYNYGIARVFELAVEGPYDGLEIMIDGRWDVRQPAYLRRLMADYGLPIHVIHSPPFIFPVPGWPDDQLARLQRTVALAQALGASMVVTHLPFRVRVALGHWHGAHTRRFLLPLLWPPRRGPYAHFVQNGLAAFEAETGVTVAVENMPSRKFLGREVNAWRFNTLADLARFPHLTLDTTHLGTWGLDPLAVYRRFRERIMHVHLSNYDRDGGREHRSPPDGDLPLVEFLRTLARDGYPGAITVETQPDALNAYDEEKCRSALRRALAFCREHFVC